MSNGSISESQHLKISQNSVQNNSNENCEDVNSKNQISKELSYNESFETACSKSFSEHDTERDIGSNFSSSLTANNNQHISDIQISPWEEWLCKKEKERREQLYKIKEEKKQKSLKEQKEREREIEKKVCADNAYKNWLNKIQENQKKELKLKNERAKIEKHDKEEKEKNIKILSEKNFKQWKKEKKKLEDEKKKQIEMQEMDKLQQKNLEKNKNEEAFKKWKKNISSRSKCQNYKGYGYVGGVLISYYDASSSPIPSYYNPRPWI